MTITANDAKVISVASGASQCEVCAVVGMIKSIRDILHLDSIAEITGLVIEKVSAIIDACKRLSVGPGGCTPSAIRMARHRERASQKRHISVTEFPESVTKSSQSVTKASHFVTKASQDIAEMLHEVVDLSKIHTKVLLKELYERTLGESGGRGRKGDYRGIVGEGGERGLGESNQVSNLETSNKYNSCPVFGKNAEIESPDSKKSDPAKDEETQKRFDEFWSIIPKSPNSSKTLTRKKYFALTVTDQKKAIRAAAAYKIEVEKLKTDERYYKMTSTFLGKDSRLGWDELIEKYSQSGVATNPPPAPSRTTPEQAKAAEEAYLEYLHRKGEEARARAAAKRVGE